eukprot:147708_1
MSLSKNCTKFEARSGEDLGSRLVPIHAHDLKNGMWSCDDSTHLPGIVSDVKMSKTGKHGHAKYTYKLKMPHSGRSSSLMHPGGDHLYKPVMIRFEYNVNLYEEADGTLEVMNDQGDEKILSLDPETEIGLKMVKAWEAYEDGSADPPRVKTLQGPWKDHSGEVCLLEVIEDVLKPEENLK